LEHRNGDYLSQSLLKAQEELERKREQVQASCTGFAHSSQEQTTRSRMDTHGTGSASLPEHLGWGSEPLTRALRYNSKSLTRQDLSVSEPAHPQESVPLLAPGSGCGGRLSNQERIRIYPDLALALLRSRLVATARIWFLLKHIDKEGRGWFNRRDVDSFLAQRNSEYHVCGQRQLRKLLAKGDGIFWRRSGGRLWLRSTSKVAAQLHLQRLSGHPVSMPLAILLRGIGEVRAHLFGCFHSGRAGDDGLSKPIARSTLKKISSLSARTQRNYELRAAISRQVNFTIGGRVTSRDLENRGWRHGRALFIYSDLQGLFGLPGLEYTAWQLPNSYRGPYDIQPNGRQKSINREIADLFMKGITGNGVLLEDSNGSSFNRVPGRYFKNGQAAATSYNLNPRQDRYWKGKVRAYSSNQLWHVFSGQNET
jgi:hypothetical protein